MSRISSPAKRARLSPSAIAMSAKLGSFVDVDAECDFPIQNLPFGVATPVGGGDARCVSAIGNYVVDLSVLEKEGFFKDMKDTFNQPNLNNFMGLGKAAWRAVRATVQSLLSADNATLRDNADLRARVLLPMKSVVMQMPCRIGDYTDFYSSREHATNVGTMFRGKDNALQPNWLHLPVGYHGRASSVVMSGTPVRRPCGQLQKDATNPKEGSVYGPCRLMDFELEVGMFVGPGNKLGEPIDMATAEDHIFGLCILNDWSARDIQKWEYVPLGPFGAKNFASTISPWIVTLDALEPFRCPTSAKAQVDPEPLPYLRDPRYGSYDIKLEVTIQDEEMKEPAVVSKSNFANLYWNIKQQLVHHTVTGCNMQPGDLLGSGTISGSTEDSYGSMLELSWKGSKEVSLGGGKVRKFLKDGDTVTMRGFCQGDGFRIGFGDTVGKITPAKPFTGATGGGGGGGGSA